MRARIGAAGGGHQRERRDRPVPVQVQARDADIILPSGQQVTLQDVVWNAPGPEGLTTRFRFIAPAIAAEGGTVDFETAAADMQWLCQNYALPRVASPGPQPSQIVISLSDIAVPFGEANPDATQFFEAYTIEDGVCVWSVF
jgi:hypothetical protein